MLTRATRRLSAMIWNSWAPKTCIADYCTAPKPYFSHIARACGDRSAFSTATEGADLLSASTAAGYTIGGWLLAGNVPTTLTPRSANASVLYTMPSGASPRATSTKAALTFSARATCASTLVHTPVPYTHLRAHETPEHLVCRLLLAKKK